MGVSLTQSETDFLIKVLNRNLVVQAYEDVCRAAMLCWHSLSESAQYDVQRAYGHIQGEVTELKYAVWAQGLEEWQKEPDNLFTLKEDNEALHYVLESCLIHKKARECSKLSMWGWCKDVVGFYYVLREDALKTLLELFVKIGKYHSDAYEYRFVKLLYLSQQLEDDWEGSQLGVFLDVRGYDGDKLTSPKVDWPFVYLMRSSTGHYKIGFSKDPNKRASELTKTPTILPIEVEVIHQFRCEDVRLAESLLHRLLHYRRHKGEWFDLTDNQVRFLQDVKHFDCTVGVVPLAAFWPC